jgi:hypothetical protein
MTATELTLPTLIWETVFGVAEGSAAKIGKGGLGLGYVRERMDEPQLHGNLYTMSKTGPVLHFGKTVTQKAVKGSGRRQ